MQRTDFRSCLSGYLLLASSKVRTGLQAPSLMLRPCSRRQGATCATCDLMDTLDAIYVLTGVVPNAQRMPGADPLSPVLNTTTLYVSPPWYR